MTQRSYLKDGLWMPERSGRFFEDCARGHRYAAELIAEMTQENNPTLLGAVVRSMIDGGKFEAVEIGFFSRVGQQIVL